VELIFFNISPTRFYSSGLKEMGKTRDARFSSSSTTSFQVSGEKPSSFIAKKKRSSRNLFSSY